MSGAATPLISVQDGVTVVSLVGPEYESLDERLLAGVQDFLLEVAKQANPPLLVVDLAHTNFFGSAFIEILFRVANRLKQRNGKFAVCNLTQYCAEVIHVTHLDTLWPVHKTTQDAVKALAEPVAG